MNITFYLKLSSFLCAWNCLESKPFSSSNNFFKSFLVKKSTLVHNFFYVFNRLECKHRSVFFFFPFRKWRVGIRLTRKELCALFGPFCGNFSNTENRICFFKKEILGANVPIPFQHYGKEFFTGFSAHKNCENYYCLSVENFFQTVLAIEQNFEKSGSDPISLDANKATLFWINQLKKNLGSVEGQTIKYIDTLKHDLVDFVRKNLDNFIFKPQMNHCYLNVLKTYEDFIQQSNRLATLFGEEYWMTRNFFESETEPVQRKLGSLIHDYQQSYKKVLVCIKGKKGIVPLRAKKQLYENKRKIGAFLRGICFLVDYLNCKFKYINEIFKKRQLELLQVQPIIRDIYCFDIHPQLHSTYFVDHSICFNSSFDSAVISQNPFIEIFKTILKQDQNMIKVLEEIKTAYRDLLFVF